MNCFLQGAEVVALVIWGGSAFSVPRAQHDSRRRLDRCPQSQEEGKQHPRSRTKCPLGNTSLSVRGCVNIFPDQSECKWWRERRLEAITFYFKSFIALILSIQRGALGLSLGCCGKIATFCAIEWKLHVCRKSLNVFHSNRVTVLRPNVKTKSFFQYAHNPKQYAATGKSHCCAPFDHFPAAQPVWVLGVEHHCYGKLGNSLS